MGTYGKSRSRIACDTLTPTTPTMTIAHLAATYGKNNEDMWTYKNALSHIAKHILTTKKDVMRNNDIVPILTVSQNIVQ